VESSRHPLPTFAMVGVAVVLTATAGLVAGIAADGTVSPTPPTVIWCPAQPGEATPNEQSCEQPPVDPAAATLRTLADAHQLRVGSAVIVNALAGEDYRGVLGREFNAVTAENAMKWSRTEPVQGDHRRTAADELVEFAWEHGQHAYGHTLVWHKQVPGWVTSGGFSDQELGELLRDRVEGEAAYFRGRVWGWDVLNEALAPDGTLTDTLWSRALGPGYVADAFRWARAADPDAKLFINDFGIAGINAKSDGLYRLVSDLLAGGVPIDGVGFQLHWSLDPLPSSLTENLQRFAALGLDIAITEMDVRMTEPVTPEKLQRQAAIYSEALASCLEVERCVSFTVWGVADAYSWVPRTYPGTGAATLFDASFAPKPAHRAMTETLEQA
jgi:endo-1,4-beta-xylanase